METSPPNTYWFVHLCVKKKVHSFHLIWVTVKCFALVQRCFDIQNNSHTRTTPPVVQQPQASCMIQAGHRIPPLVLSSLFHEWGPPFVKAGSKHAMLQICTCIGDVQSIRPLSQIIFFVYPPLCFSALPQCPQTFGFRSFASGFFLISASSESCSAFPWSN